MSRPKCIWGNQPNVLDYLDQKSNCNNFDCQSFMTTETLFYPKNNQYPIPDFPQFIKDVKVDIKTLNIHGRQT